MTDALKILKNIRSLRAIAKDVELEQLEEILEKIKIVIEEKREALAKIAQQKAEKLKALEEVHNLLREKGISTEELLSSSINNVGKTKQPARPAKYQYTDNGRVRTWTGKGRTPLAIQRELEAGKSLSDFEI
ncbi:H-NS family nucleoid-associated regulatory protein [Avibacterium paragallinarum]|uniref:H-NS family histone-like protein n=1 Tax=Avibacterium paragallinarum TaxID=728 RepID=UPI0039783995